MLLLPCPLFPIVDLLHTKHTVWLLPLHCRLLVYPMFYETRALLYEISFAFPDTPRLPDYSKRHQPQWPEGATYSTLLTPVEFSGTTGSARNCLTQSVAL
jgi:hypothetical protein